MSRHISLRGLATVAVLVAVANSCSPYSNEVLNPRTSPGGIFDHYVAIGNSITAGYQSGGMIDSAQRRAYPFLLAQSMGTRYQYASFTNRGCPPLIQSFLTQARPAGTTAATCDLRGNSTDILNNVAVPGAWSGDPTAASSANSTALTTFILGGKTQVARALQAEPTFVSVWIGNNDVLGPAVSSPGLSTTAALAAITGQTAFNANIDAIVDPLKAAGAKGVIIGVVNVANAPILFRGSAFVGTGNIKAAFDAIACGAGTQSTTCAGTATTLDPGCTANSTELINAFLAFAIRTNQHPAYVACNKSNPFAAQGVGDAFVLDNTEQATVTAAVNGYNAYLSSKATAAGWAYVDPNVTLAALKTTGTLVRPVPLFTSATAPFGTGMSLDGVHPGYLVHAEIANAIIAAVNTKYSTALTAIVP